MRHSAIRHWKRTLRACGWLAGAGGLATSLFAASLDVKETATYRTIKATLDATPAIDTHDHLPPFAIIQGRVDTDRGFGMNLHSLWRSSYYIWFNPLSAWPKSGRFDEWWSVAKHDFDNARATSFYRYQLSAFTDLYGVDFDAITDVDAAKLDRQIFDHYQDPRWVYEVVTQRANIELMVMDPYWDRLGFELEYPFAVPTVNVTALIRGARASDFPNPKDSPYRFAAENGLKIESLDDYLTVIERIMAFGKSKGAICLKTTTAYERTLEFEKVSKERAEEAWGRPASQATRADTKALQDYVMWRLVDLSARLDLPFQIHTGHARIQGSNPMLLVDLIAANPKTKFILFHGGYPWIGETGAIATRHSNVWIDSVWLPTISYTMGKRAYQEWLEVMGSNKILWGADAHHAEGIYAATEFTRRCLAEALAEKVERKELREEHALRIGRQILRENALELFPSLKTKLWKHTGRKMLPDSVLPK
ncbi:MAG: amidohydrolase family protein [Verrucomicrobiales bacterium]|nr:amidohydrolase family protein [Verrucomicrobiales bacterium]